MRRPLAVLTLLGLLVVAVGVGAEGVSAQQSPAPISPICTLAFETALGPAGSRPTASPSAVPSLSASLEPALSPGAPPAASVLPDPSILDDAIRSCASVEEWEAVAASYPATFGATDPRAMLLERCTDPAAGLDAYATCASLALAIKTPAPTAVPTPVPLPTVPPSQDGEGDDPPDADPDEPRLVRPPRRMTARVPGATSIRYFAIRGDDPNELIIQASRRSVRFCPQHAAACVRYRPNVRARTETNVPTGDCRIVGVSATLTADVFLPRWAMPKRVEPELLAWWRKMFRRIAAHEAQHIKIAKRHLAALPRRVVGKSCSRFSTVFGRWSSAMTREQDAFDIRDRQRPLPPYRGSQS